MTDSKESHTQKLLAGGAVKVRIALASGLILTVGSWLAPRAAQTSLSVPQEHAAPLLEEQVQLREVSRPFVGVQDVAAPARQYSVAILPVDSPVAPSRSDYSEASGGGALVAGFGVFVSDRYVLTHSAALDGRSSAAVSVGDNQTMSGQVVAYEPETGLVLLEVQRAAARTSASMATEAPTSGALAVAVGQSTDRELAVPVFVTSVGGGEYTIGVAKDALMPGMPIFNLAGELFAIAAPDRQDVRAIPVREAAERMLGRAASGTRQSSFGLGFQVLSGRLIDAFGNEGVLITEVLPGSPADAAGIRVGDVLLSVGDVMIDSADAATRALGAAEIGVQTTLRIRRGTRVTDVPATSAFVYEVAALARSGVELGQGPEARTLFPAAVLESGAIPPSARVVSINGRPPTTRAQVLRELRTARRLVPILLRQGNRQFFAAAEPTR